MAKLTVKNVGPIREAEFEVKKHTVFIGPQGSGKSTLAKLIAIGGDKEAYKNEKELLGKYNIEEYVSENSLSIFNSEEYQVKIDYNIVSFEPLTAGLNNYKISRSKFLEEVNEINKLRDETEKRFQDVEVLLKADQNPEEFLVKQMLNSYNEIKERQGNLIDLVFSRIAKIETTYIPSERTLLSILSRSVWNLINSNVGFPKILLSFASTFERIRNQIIDFHIPFLNITYEHRQGEDILIYPDGRISLSQSASGHQSIVPLLVVVEELHQHYSRRFIIEEPELNLYPVTQKDLIYNMIGGVMPHINYPNTEWVITTHSPYVLTSLNTLMLAYKVAQRSDELKEEVKKIVPERCWINPDEFAAYYVDNGTVESITNPETGLINDSRLDDVSEDFAGEQDKLFALYRTAVIND